jgi:Zn-dependent peptidase ImmA (M78 family)
LFDKYESRYRFTLAHEIGHKILHKLIFEELGFSNSDEWKYIQSVFNPKQYGKMEYQADCFAGLVLVPSFHLKNLFNGAI